jgi:enoyl-[acyl-carrier protein] reductase I
MRALDEPAEQGQFMGFLQDRRILVTGVLSNRSIAYGIAQALAREGSALAFTYQNEDLRGRVAELAKDFGTIPVLPCDVTHDDEMRALFDALGREWDGLDGIVHSIAYAPREALKGDFLEGFTRENFRIAHEVSAYSFAALAKAGLPLMEGRRAALLTLTYLGAVRSVPHYNVMGLAKASLEAVVRYLACDLGPKGIRVNGISAGPIRTLAASGIGNFSRILKYVAESAPLRRNVTVEDVGNAAAFLMSDLAAGITGEITYVDCGFNTTVGGMAPPEAAS